MSRSRRDLIMENAVLRFPGQCHHGHPRSYGWMWLAAPWVWGWGPYPYFGIRGPYGFGWYTGLIRAGYGWGGYRELGLNDMDLEP